MRRVREGDVGQGGGQRLRDVGKRGSKGRGREGRGWGGTLFTNTRRWSAPYIRHTEREHSGFFTRHQFQAADGRTEPTQQRLWANRRRL